MGLFAFASLLNHSCYPNLEIQRTITCKTQFVAVRDIEPDEELAFDYLGVYQEGEKVDLNQNLMRLGEEEQLTVLESFVKRQNKMKEEYEMFCACPLCVRDSSLAQVYQQQAR